jgi:RND superfamily putative drug exporter
MAIVPALMTLFGKSNWWLPGWLDRIIPNVGFEPADVVIDEVDEADEDDSAPIPAGAK